MEHGSLSARARLLALAAIGVLLVSAIVVAVAFVTTMQSAQSAQSRIQVLMSSVQELTQAQTRASGSLSDYVITQRERALTDHQAALQRAQTLVTELGSHPELATDVAAVESAQQAWVNADVNPTLAAMSAGDAQEAARATNKRAAWSSFDAMVAATDALDARVNALIDEAYGQERDYANALLITLIVVGLVLLAVALGLMIVTRRWVLRPLTHLRREFTTTTRDPHHVIAAEGPTELIALGMGAEDLRRSLVEEMDRALAARQGLEDEAPLAAAVARELEQPESAREGDVAWAGTTRASAGVSSGDWWQVWPLTDGAVACVIADVSGHGPAAAVTALRARTIVRASLTNSRSLLATMGLLADFHADRTNTLTIFLAVIDPLRNTMTWVNAGHHAPVVITARGELGYCKTTGPLVSALGGQWEVSSRVFVRGDLFVAFTDGLVEKNNDHSDSTDGQIAEYLQGLDASVRREPWEVITRLGAAIRELSPDWSHDDVTILGVVRTH